VILNITEVKRPEVDAQLVAENIALQMERRVSFRRAMKKNVLQAMKFGAKGIKAMCAGRLWSQMAERNGTEKIGASSTIRADIDYGYATAATIRNYRCKSVGFKGEIYQEAR
jgi:small subunit ribosomal protein S3